MGEPAETMYEIIEAVEPYMPAEKPRYLMGVGTPVNILEGVAGALTCLTACFQPETHGMESCTLGTEP